ncbi:E3 ubiquitin-protein ligase RMA1H1 [Platanthera guangdongensis]|uniref:E3 ubiquitin-protein ligase RMA n=1 Tax=Platanthera guangdongensis TaxID=2320717 RepID=A0ABR2LMF0_9ASPA
MADEESVSRPAAMDLNLYLGVPRSSRTLSLDLGSDLSLCSLPLPSSSNSGESRAAEATSGAMEPSASHAPQSPFHAFINEADVPSVSPWPLDLENPMRPYFHAYEPYVPSCAQEDEGPSALYSPSVAQGLQMGQIAVDPAERDEQHHSSIDEILGLHLVADDSVHAEEFQTQCSRTHPPPSADFQDEHLHRSPDFRIRRVLESHGWRPSLLEQSLYGVDTTNFAPNSSPSSEQFMPEMTISQPNGKQKAPAEPIDSESSEKGADEKNKCSTNFDCNVCFDISKEPVVTSCGHLFCWPCLYQWLHLHSLHKECPVCKGEVIEANITPIYGRGNSGSEMESKDEESKALGLSIPPRPRGHRKESWRQHFYQNSRRFGEGILNPRRRFPGYQLSSMGRLVELDNAFMQELLSREPPALLTRSMMRRFERAHEITESRPSTEESRFLGELLPRDGDAVPVPDEIDAANEIHSLIAMNFERRAGGSFSENADQHGLSPSVNAPIPDQFYSIPIVGRHVTDQASASSTAAMICGESSVRDASTGPHSAGSSRPPRTIRVSSAASSSDDGGNLLHSRKRRRLH